uniref:Uncharacterized protein n=1 Tax=Timema poppense TaxID=170557 RepID=A0A7R9DLM5_TIMPO|nr:unnamed protein product [Timema poppensis]
MVVMVATPPPTLTAGTWATVDTSTVEW